MKELKRRILIKKLIEMIRMRRKMWDRGGNLEAGVENRIETETEKEKNKEKKIGKSNVEGNGKDGTKITIDKEKGNKSWL